MLQKPGVSLTSIFSHPQDVAGEDVPSVQTNSASLTVSAYETVVAASSRLRLLCAVNDLVPTMNNGLEATQNTFNLDIVCLDAVLTVLEPVGDEMTDASVRRVWSIKVTAVSTYVKQLEGLLVNAEPLTESDKVLVVSIKQKCMRLQMVKYFLIHTLHDDVSVAVQQAVCTKLRVLLAALKKPDFCYGPQTFNKIRRAIEGCCKAAGQAILESKGIRECIICREAITEPVILPCRHVACKACLEEELLSGTRVCPSESCGQEVPDDFQLRSDCEIEQAVEEHTKFRQKLTQFLVEVLQNFVFNDENMPHKDIIDILLSFIVTQNRPKDEKNQRTKQSPLSGD